MNKSRHLQREQRKQALLQQIQLQRQSLSEHGQQWLALTRTYDHSWQTLLSFKPYFAAGSGILLLYGIRHPKKLYRWSLRMLGVWKLIDTVRNIFNRR